MQKVFPIIESEGSDSAMIDNAIELLLLGGRTLPHAMMMVIPEAWSTNPHMPHYKRAFYEYHAALTEAWDGPAAMVFTDGKVVGGTLDRKRAAAVPLHGDARRSGDPGIGDRGCWRCSRKR